MLMICLLSMEGCWKKTEILRQSMTPIPEDVHGVLYVATNRKIPVGLEGTDEVTAADVGGYYLVHKNDLTAMMRIIKKSAESKTESGQ